MNVSIMTACVPLLRPFWDKLHSGGMDIRAPLPVSGRHTYVNSSDKRSKPSFGGSKNKSKKDSSRGTVRHTASQAELTGHSIQQTTEFRVDVDSGAEPYRMRDIA